MQKNKYILKRKILLITFTLMLVFSLATITFSWYRNYVEVTGPEITTGHINVNMHTYYVNNNVINEEKNQTINENTHGNVVLNSGIQSFLPDGKTHMYYFFENPESYNSIDLEVLLSMNIEGLYTDYEVSKIGGVNITLDNETADFKDWVTQRYPTNPIFSEARFESYIKDANVNHTGGDTKNFLELEKAMITGSVNRNDILCIRVTVSLNEAITVSHLNKQYPLRMSLCVAQEGGLPGLEKVTTFYASTLSSLNAALNLYKPNDKIIITDDIDYVGDLIINRPVEIYVQDGVLNVYGNFMFTYSYPGKFMVNTAQAGQICVYRINNAGGDFEIDVPNASVELIGRNNSVNGNADIYVQRNMTVTASEDTGLVMTSSRICETVGEGIFLDTLKDIELGNHTRIEVGSRTNVGNIHSEGSIIRVRNNGTINEINLELLQQDITYVTSPNIFIDNYSNISVIKLPEWSSKFIMTETEDPSTGEPVQDYTGNTRIVSNMGASFDAITCSGQFKYDGSKDPERDDVEYTTMSQFVEAVNGDKTDVIVHYTLTEIAGLANDNTLQGIMEYYIKQEVIANFSEIKKLKIITYSGSFLTYNTTDNKDGTYYNDDYELIREMMTSITHLDLSEAVSVNYTVPKQAFLKMSKLTHVDMSETDTTWEDNLFNNTGVVEIRLTSSAIYMPTITVSNKQQCAVTGLKYVHTDYNILDPIATWGKTAGQYIFTPDKTTYDAYRAKGTLSQYTFLEATRYVGKLGDYFLRVNESEKTFEVATIVQTSLDLYAFSTTDFMFNFDTIVLNGEEYKLTKIDDYAFYTKKFTNSASTVDLIIGDAVEVIGASAFKNCSGIVTLKILGPSRIQQNAFQSISSLLKVEAQFAPFIGTYAFGSSQIKYFYAPSLVEAENYFLQGNKSFKVVEVGMIADTSIKFFGSAGTDTIIIHTDSSLSPESFTTKINLDGSFQTLIVNEEYESIWKTSYPNADIVSIKGSAKNDLIRVGSDIFPEYFYSKNENNELTLVKAVVQKIDGDNQDYIVPTISKIDNSLIYTNDDPNAYPLVEIGNYAFKYTQFYNMKSLNMPNTVKKIGAYAFIGKNGNSTSGDKSYGILHLNNVEEVGNYAFQYNKMVEIDAPNVVTAYLGSFYNCATTFKASLPKLKNTTGTLFSGHTGLRFVNMGPCDGSMNGTINGRNGIVLIIVDATSSTDIVKTGINSAGYPLIIVGGNSSNAIDIVVESFDDLYLCDFYVETMSYENNEYEYTIPSYIFNYKSNELVLTMRTAQIDESKYVVPNEIFPTSNTEKFLGKDFIEYVTIRPAGYNGNRYLATKIGDCAFAYTKVSTGCEFIVGGGYTTVGYRGLASITPNILDLNNVTVLQELAVDQCKAKVVISDKVEIVNKSGLAGLSNVDIINLPNVVSLGEYGVRGSGLKTLICGDRLESLGRHVFEQNQHVETIYILSTKIKLTIDFIYEPNVANVGNIKLYTHNSKVDYFKTNSNSKDIVDSNIFGFENSYVEESTGLIYLWSDLGEQKAKVEGIVGLTSASGITQIILPNNIIVKITEGEEEQKILYKVTEIDEDFFSGFKETTYISSLVLPDELEVFGADNSLLVGSGISSISISETNEKYETYNGVLYTKGREVLMFYPIAKQDVTFVLPDEVKYIYSSAFANNNYITSVIVPNAIVIMDSAFEGCGLLENVVFESNIASTLIGKNMFNKTSQNLQIYVPTGSKDSYIANIIFDLELIDLIQEQSNS